MSKALKKKKKKNQHQGKCRLPGRTFGAANDSEDEL